MNNFCNFGGGTIKPCEQAVCRASLIHIKGLCIIFLKEYISLICKVPKEWVNLVKGCYFYQLIQKTFHLKLQNLKPIEKMNAILIFRNKTLLKCIYLLVKITKRCFFK